MSEGYIPIFVHDTPCCGMVVHMDTKELGNNTTGMKIVCPLHDEVDPEACRIWGQEDENRGR